MDEERWTSLVQRLEPLARSHPRRYRRRVVLLAALGYAVVGLMLLLLVGAGMAFGYLLVAGRDRTERGPRAPSCARWLGERYWPGVLARVRDEAAPPPDAFTQLARDVAEARRSEDVEAWYRTQLEVETEPTDTHPSLAERLAHLGVASDEALLQATVESRPSAAAVYLGDAEPGLLAELDRLWNEQVAGEWRGRHAKVAGELAELARLDAEASPSAADALRRAELTEEYRDEDAALDRWRELLCTENDLAARFAVERLLLERDDDEGLRLLDEASRDPDATVGASVVAYGYLREHGCTEEADERLRRLEDDWSRLQAAEVERSEVSARDRLEPPTLGPEGVARVRQVVAREHDVAEAYLVRKRTSNYDAERPFHVLALVRTPGLRAVVRRASVDLEDRSSLVRRVAGRLDVPDEVLVVTVRPHGRLASRLRRVRGARVR